MTAKPLPPDRPRGAVDLLDTADEHPSDPSWRADSLGRSRHSRLADEIRPPWDELDPARAELVCARIAREALGDYAPALVLLSRERRRRAQTLSAWTVTLFDLALRPGLAGLDGDRLAQINAWEFRTEEALDGSPPGEPVFVAMASQNEIEPWPREALDRILAAARRVALRGGPSGVGSAILEALFGATGGGGAVEAAKNLAPLIDVAIASATIGSATDEWRAGIESVRAVPVGSAPAGWARAASYGKRALLRLSSRLELRVGVQLGLGGRLRLLVLSAVWPR